MTAAMPKPRPGSHSAALQAAGHKAGDRITAKCPGWPGKPCGRQYPVVVRGHAAHSALFHAAKCPECAAARRKVLREAKAVATPKKKRPPHDVGPEAVAHVEAAFDKAAKPPKVLTVAAVDKALKRPPIRSTPCESCGKPSYSGRFCKPGCFKVALDKLPDRLPNSESAMRKALDAPKVVAPMTAESSPFTMRPVKVRAADAAAALETLRVHIEDLRASNEALLGENVVLGNQVRAFRAVAGASADKAVAVIDAAGRAG